MNFVLKDDWAGDWGKYTTLETYASLVENIRRRQGERISNCLYHPDRKYKSTIEDGYYLINDSLERLPGHRLWQWVLGAGYWLGDSRENKLGLELPHNFQITERDEGAIQNKKRINLANSLFLGEVNTNARRMDTRLVPGLRFCPKFGCMVRVNSRMYSPLEYANEVGRLGIVERLANEKEAIALAAHLPLPLLVTHPRVLLAVSEEAIAPIAQWAALQLDKEPVYQCEPSVYSPKWDILSDEAQEDHWLISSFQAYDKVVGGGSRKTWRSLLPEECAYSEMECVIGLTWANKVIRVTSEEIRPVQV